MINFLSRTFVLHNPVRRNASGKITDYCCRHKVPPLKSEERRHDDGSAAMYRIVSLFFGLPLVVLVSASLLFDREEPERAPFVKHEYLRKRTKKFPWGDGNHSLFHNPRTNALPDGYEDEK